MNIGCQVEFRRSKRILGITDEPAVAPKVHSLLHTLEADAHPLAAQVLVQVELFDVAAYGVIIPIDLRRTQGGTAIPRVEGVGVLNLPVALQFNVPGHADGAKGGQVGIRLIEIRRACGGVSTPGEAPGTVQRLPQRGQAGFGLRLGFIADMVRVGIQPVHGKHGGVGQPVQFGCHSVILFYRSLGCFLAQRSLK